MTDEDRLFRDERAADLRERDRQREPLARITSAIKDIGAECEPAPDWQERVLEQTRHDVAASVEAAAAFVCGDGLPAAFLDAQEYEVQRAAEPDHRDEDDDDQAYREAALEDSISEVIVERATGGAS